MRLHGWVTRERLPNPAHLRQRGHFDRDVCSALRRAPVHLLGARGTRFAALLTFPGHPRAGRTPVRAAASYLS
eukprot:5593883-Alexandrium_andersonii.AAC.1